MSSCNKLKKPHVHITCDGLDLWIGMNKQNLFNGVTVQCWPSVRHRGTSYAERPFTGRAGGRNCQNSLSDWCQTRKRRRTITPPVENVLACLYRRLQISWHLISELWCCVRSVFKLEQIVTAWSFPGWWNGRRMSTSRSSCIGGQWPTRILIWFCCRLWCVYSCKRTAKLLDCLLFFVLLGLIHGNVLLCNKH